MYGHMIRSIPTSKALRWAGVPGPSWGWDQAFYDTRTETPSVNLIYDVHPYFDQRNDFGACCIGMNLVAPLNQAEWAKIQRQHLWSPGAGAMVSGANANNVLPFMSFGDVSECRWV